MMPRFIEVRSTEGDRILNVEAINLFMPAEEGGAEIHMAGSAYRCWTGPSGQTYEEIIALMIAAGAVVHRQAQSQQRSEVDDPAVHQTN